MTDQLALAFDYTALDPDTRTTVETCRDEISRHEKLAGESVVEIGRHLKTVQDAMPGRFEEWLKIEFEWSRRTAYNLIQVADVFGSRMCKRLHIGPSALYALAAESTPDEIREEFIARAEAGEPVRHRDVQAAIAATKPAPPPAHEPDEDDAESLGEQFDSLEEAIGTGTVASHTPAYQSSDSEPEEPSADPTPIRKDDTLDFVKSLPSDAKQAWVKLVKQTEMEPFVAHQLADARAHVHEATVALSRIPEGEIGRLLHVEKIFEHVNDTSLMAMSIFLALKDSAGDPAKRSTLRRVQ